MAWTTGVFRCLPVPSLALSLATSARSRLATSLSTSALVGKQWNVTTTAATTISSSRLLSTTPSSNVNSSTVNANTVQPALLQAADGRQFAVFDTSRRKLKPHIVARRLNRMRIFEGAEKSIRHSPWRLNLVCQLVAGLPLQQALTQLEFCKKSKAPLVQKVLQRTANLADIRAGLQPSQLEVAECFATRATPLKRMKTMGRGRTGRMEHKHSHMRLVLREIDFKLRIYQAPSVNQKKRWFVMQQEAERDAARAAAEREEIQRLEKQTAAAAAAAAK